MTAHVSDRRAAVLRLAIGGLVIALLAMSLYGCLLGKRGRTVVIDFTGITERTNSWR